MKILYFGPITPKGEASIGGFEAANRKNIEALRARHIEVEEFRNPTVRKSLGKLGKLVYVKLFFTPFALLKYAGRKEVIVHVTPLYGSLLGLPSNLLLLLAKALRIPSVSDIRAGSFFYYWEHKGRFSRWSLRHLLTDASYITVEGSSYIQPMRSIVGGAKPIGYFPNLAVCQNLTYTERKRDMINLFYFGRITQNKGIEILLDTIQLLDTRFHLFLAGGIAPDVDKKELSNDRVTYLGTLNPMQLHEEMRRMHIFVFPTSHVGEGQSNSLIEAMSEGLIPVTSNQGFCAEVVGDCGRVLPQGSSTQDYCQAIEAIASRDLELMAQRCQAHIKACHNIDKEIPKLIKIYCSL